jgi:hypothetical protein
LAKSQAKSLLIYIMYMRRATLCEAINQEDKTALAAGMCGPEEKYRSEPPVGAPYTAHCAWPLLLHSSRRIPVEFAAADAEVTPRRCRIEKLC